MWWLCPLFLSLRGQLVHSVGFAGSTVSAGTAPLCWSLGKAALVAGLYLKQFYLQTQAVSGLDWLAGCRLLSGSLLFAPDVGRGRQVSREKRSI